MEDNTKNIYLEKSCGKYGVETRPWLVSFSEKVKFCIFLDQHSEFQYSLFLLYIPVQDY